MKYNVVYRGSKEPLSGDDITKCGGRDNLDNFVEYLMGGHENTEYNPNYIPEDTDTDDSFDCVNLVRMYYNNDPHVFVSVGFEGYWDSKTNNNIVTKLLWSTANGRDDDRYVLFYGNFDASVHEKYRLKQSTELFPFGFNHDIKQAYPLSHDQIDSMGGVDTINAYLDSIGEWFPSILPLGDKYVKYRVVAVHGINRTYLAVVNQKKGDNIFTMDKSE